MKAWTVVALTRDGEYVCEGCLADDIERAIWDDDPVASKLMEDHQIGVVFASDEYEDASCGRCGEPI